MFFANSLETTTKKIGNFVALSILMYLAAELGHFMSFSGSSYATIWPPSGILLASLLASRPRQWTMPIFATAMGSIANNFAHQLPAVLCFIYPIGNAFAAVIGASFIEIGRREPFKFSQISDFFSFLVFGAVVACAIDAMFGAAVTKLFTSNGDFWFICRMYGIAAAIGVTVFCPVFQLLFSRHASYIAFPKSSFERASSAIAIALSIFFTFKIFITGAQNSSPFYSMPSVITIFIAWAAISSGIFLSSVNVMIIGTMVTYGISRGHAFQYFYGFSVANQESLIQIRVLGITMVSLLISINFESAKAAIQAKSLFLANVSHELRTPLTAILGYSELMNDPALKKAEQQLFLGVIQRNAKILASQVNDILDLSSIDAGKLKITSQPINALELIQEVIENQRARIHDKKISISASFADNLPKSILTDPLRLKQILTNVIGNAVKFTDQGFVDISVCVSAKKGRKQLQIEVKDTGIGIDLFARRFLFTPFYQSLGAAKASYVGTGLGLALSRTFAKMLGGDVILVESRPGEGSKFRITIELKSFHRDEEFTPS